MSRSIASSGVLRKMLVQIARAWSQFWFRSSPTAPIELTRIGIGAALLVNYSLATPYLFHFWGEAGWMPLSIVFANGPDFWKQSVFFYFGARWQWVAFHSLFLLCCFCLMIGWRTSWVKWIVLVGQLSYDRRNPVLPYGVDSILACLLLILCMAPIGRAMSFDRARKVRAAKRHDLEAVLPVFRSAWAGACMRLIQIQMALLFLYSGLNKVRGDDWWNGDAIWLVFVTNDYYIHSVVDILAAHYWLVNIATYSTILIEIAFPFLVWQKQTRPFLLSAAIFLHSQFALLMGMPYFSFVMISGHMSFVRPRWLGRLAAAWKHRVGEMEMIYDGRCGFCVRSMAWFLSFDGLRQIKTRDFRNNPSPIVTDAKLEKALYLVLPDGRAFRGFEAYRHVVPRVPGMWWLAPLFYVPCLSRLVGHPIYNWVASNRSRLSLMMSPTRGT
jgi:predicted DCC family thiol-disulfide oxidoreductase YuxK